MRQFVIAGTIRLPSWGQPESAKTGLIGQPFSPGSRTSAGGRPGLTRVGPATVDQSPIQESGAANFASGFSLFL